ncbi:MAG: hypothetical protein IK089_01950 [Oxalobacter sp.]|jgi:hypothetical protein|nr:hypothetical protein [Oxalobacter sp.]
MIKKLLTGAILLASATAFAQPRGHHHHGGYMMKYNMSKVKYYDGASKERLKCHDHGRLFTTEHHGWRKEVGVCQYSRNSNRASWIAVTDGGSHGSLGRDCTLDSAYGWECRSWDRIHRVEFSTSQEERIYERDIRAKVAR